MNPKFWGPHAWIFLHSITMSYPKEPTEQDKQIYLRFFNDLQNIIPCDKCQYNYSNNLEKYPIESGLKTRETLIQWLINIHNEVNKENGSPEYTYDQVIEEYQYKMMNLGRDQTMVYKIIIVFLVIYIGYLFYKKK